MKSIRRIVINSREPQGNRNGKCYADLLFYKVKKDGSFTNFKNEEITEFRNTLNYVFDGKQGKALITSEKGFILVRNYLYYWRDGSHSGAPETKLLNYLRKLYKVYFN